jgi:hypothetical protein
VARFDRAIPPGGKGNILLKFNSKGYQGVTRKSGVVYSNDPNNLSTTLTITANVKVPILVKPGRVMLKGFPGDEIAQEVTIEARENKPLEVSVSEMDLPEKVAYELKAIENGKIFQLVLRNTLQKESSYRGHITLQTNYPQKPAITIPIIGFVRGNLEIQPGQINFFPPEPQALNRDDPFYSRSVLVALHQGNDLKIMKTEVNRDFFETRVTELQPGKRFRVEVKLRREQIAEIGANEILKIYTNQKDHPVMTVPMRILAKKNGQNPDIIPQQTQRSK